MVRVYAVPRCCTCYHRPPHSAFLICPSQLRSDASTAARHVTMQVMSEGGRKVYLSFTCVSGCCPALDTCIGKTETDWKMPPTHAFYTANFKRQVILEAEASNNMSASRKFSVNQSNIRLWRQQWTLLFLCASTLESRSWSEVWSLAKDRSRISTVHQGSTITAGRCNERCHPSQGKAAR